MIIFKSQREIELMKAAGDIVAACHKELRQLIAPGVNTLEIDRFVEEYLAKHGATAAQKGYHGYRFATCASVNDEVCHGFPNKKPLKNGDIVTIDFVANLDGYLADSAWTHPVGTIDEQSQRLLAVARAALYRGIEQARPGNRLGDIGHAIQSFVEAEGFSVVREFTGHGIGRNIHEDPAVLNYGKPGKGAKLKEGMVITIEPMVNVGAWQCKIDNNDWTARTIDGKRSAQYEHTLAITADGPVVLTEQGLS